jgi:hypothetical protein
VLRPTLIGILLLVGTVAHDAEAQRRAPTGPATTAGRPGSTEISIIARLGTKSYTSKLPGTCRHAPTASIYDVPAALWMVQTDDSDGSEVKQLNFTLWQPKNGTADQISVLVEAGTTSNRIEINPRDPPVGAATVQLQPIGPGGKFELRGQDATGTKVYLTISCPTFGAVEAEGG